MQVPKIVAAKAIGPTTLVIEFTNYEIKQYDICGLLNKPMFFPLRELTFFKSFSIEPGGYGLVWNDEIDISEYELWKNGVVIGD
jgi:hypothetical protein